MTIIELNNIDDELASNVRDISRCLKDDTVVLVWAVWCPHCVVMKDDWERLKSTISKRVNVVEIESSNLDKIRDSHKALFKKLYGKDGRVHFPMIKMWKDNVGIEYENERTFAGMKKAINKHYPKAAKAKKVVSGAQGGGGNSNDNAFNVRQLQIELNRYIANILKGIK